MFIKKFYPYGTSAPTNFVISANSYHICAVFPDKTTPCQSLLTTYSKVFIYVHVILYSFFTDALQLFTIIAFQRAAILKAGNQMVQITMLKILKTLLARTFPVSLCGVKKYKIQ